MDHCEELQSFVVDLKTSMEQIVGSMTNIQNNDHNLKCKIDSIEIKCRKDITEIMTTIEGLKAELGTVTETVRQLQRQQNELTHQLREWGQNMDCTQKTDAPSKSISYRRSRSVDMILADHDSGIHSSSGGVMTDPSSSPQSGRTSPTSHTVSPTVKGDVIGQSRALTSNLKRHLIPSHSSPLLCLDLGSDQEREDSDAETLSVMHRRSQQFQVQPQQAAGRIFTAVKKISRRPSQSRHQRNGPPSTFDASAGERFKLLSEILSTERAYCNRLWHMQVNICEPLKDANLVCQKDLNTLFPQELKLIYEQHCVFLHKLQTRLSSWNGENQVPLVSVFRPQFDARGYLACVYADYASSFSNITVTFKENFLRNTDLIKFLKTRVPSQRVKDSEVDLRLDDFLVMPLERVSYYISTLKKLQQLAEVETEKQQLSIVLSNLEEVAAEINRSVIKALSLNSSQLSSDRADQSDSSTDRPPIKKRYSKKQSQSSGDNCAVLNRSDSAARRARSAAALARRQQQLVCVKEISPVPVAAPTVSGSNAQLADSKCSSNMEMTRTFPRKPPRQQDKAALELAVPKNEERFLTFGRGDAASRERSSPLSTGFANGIAEKALVRSSTSASVSSLAKSKYENCHSEPDLSQATSISADDSSSQVQTADEADSIKMPITIKDARRRPSPSPMPVLNQRARRYTTTNVMPISYTHTSDFDSWRVNSNAMSDQTNNRSTSLSPSRSVSFRTTPTDCQTNEAFNTRKIKYVKAGASGKNVHSLKNSLAAFFSKRKNEQRFGVPANRRVPGGMSYSYWPGGGYRENGSDAGSVRSTITLASNPNVRLLAGAIPRPQFSPSPKEGRRFSQSYGFDYRRDSLESAHSGLTQRRGNDGTFAPNTPLYWWHKKKVPFEHGNSSDVVEV